MKIYEIRILGLLLDTLLYERSPSVHDSQIILVCGTVPVEYLIHEPHPLLGAEFSHLAFHERLKHRCLLSTYGDDTVCNKYDTKRDCGVCLSLISYLYRRDIHDYQCVVVLHLNTRALLIIQGGSYIRQIYLKSLGYALTLIYGRLRHHYPGSRTIFLYFTQNSVICSVQCDHFLRLLPHRLQHASNAQYRLIILT